VLLHSPRSLSATALHRDLNIRALAFARQHRLLHDLSPGRAPSVIFGANADDSVIRHGNFIPASYQAILENSAWRRRLDKAHTASRRARPRADWVWRELDCAASSDALLMTVFCYPGVLAASALCALLNIERDTQPRFGVYPRLRCERSTRPLTDRTEVDMQIDTLLIEAKLTETGFQTARPALLQHYPGWEQVFDEPALPRTASGAYRGYQLIRGILAAQASGLRFCVLCDARRSDLVEQWHTILRAVPGAALRCQLSLLTWQELTATLPAPLQEFLAEKYGIQSA
jgi:hypothetical protein